MKNTLSNATIRWVLLALTGILAVGHALALAPRNLLFLQLAGATFNARLLASPPNFLESTQADNAFVRGWLANLAGDLPTVEAAWTESLQADDRYLAVMRMTAHQDRQLAELAVTLYPNRAEGWDWLADITAVNDPVTAATLYQRAAALSPFDNLIWEKLYSVAFQNGDKALAQTAAENACDEVPIRNGACHKAARLAYEKEDWDTVIYYFVRGNYPEHIEDWVLLIRAAQKADRSDEATQFLALAHQRLPANYEQLLQQASP